jgi:methionine sulfoxide reductase heme-binding subunit
MGWLLASVPSAAHVAGDPRLWYVTRAAGIAAYVLLALAVDLGIFRSLARQLGEPVSWALDEFHQFLTLLAAGFVLLHLVTLAFDPFIHFTPRNLLLPLDQPYRQLAVDLGVLALYALAVVLLSSWLRRRLPYATWRGIHYLGFAAFALVTVHGLLAGADGAAGWMRAIYIAAAASASFLIGIRVLVRRRLSPGGFQTSQQ